MMLTLSDKVLSFQYNRRFLVGEDETCSLIGSLRICAIHSSLFMCLRRRHLEFAVDRLHGIADLRHALQDHAGGDHSREAHGGWQMEGGGLEEVPVEGRDVLAD